MRPFKVPKAIADMIKVYPNYKDIIDSANIAGTAELYAISRLWLSEGIPFAFRQLPGLYEIIRDWIAQRLEIHPKELTLIGSARQGSSLAPLPKTGKPFGSESDLDWSAISKSLFEKCKTEYLSWVADYKINIVHPRNPTEKKYWDDNLIMCHKALQRGFIDPNKIPTWDRYPVTQLVGNTMWLIKAKCQESEGAPSFKKATIRIYRDWHSFINQLATNLKYTAEKYDKNADIPKNERIQPITPVDGV